MNELYHYGILGMKWGHHKAKTIGTNTNKRKTKNKKEKQIDPYKRAVRRSRIISNVGTGLLVTSKIMKSVGSDMYAKHAANATRGQAITMQILGYGSKIGKPVGIGMQVLGAATSLNVYNKYKNPYVNR